MSHQSIQELTLFLNQNLIQQQGITQLGVFLSQLRLTKLSLNISKNKIEPKAQLCLFGQFASLQSLTSLKMIIDDIGLDGKAFEVLCLNTEQLLQLSRLPFI
jgi:hypothetical protein